MAKDRKGTFEVLVRYIDNTKPGAKRVDVKEVRIQKDSSGKAWRLVGDVKRKASMSWGVLLVDVIVYEEGEQRWSLR